MSLSLRAPLHSNEMVVDLFAGGGGASQGIVQATGRHPDLAINHDPEAVAIHARNHPTTRHLCQSIWKVKPEATECSPERAIGLLWASPACQHFSRAAGGTPKSKQSRALPGVVLTWAKRRRPRVIIVENVREMEMWGPLLDDGTPCPKRVGASFNNWVGRLRGMGYAVQWRELCAADFGVPTIRSRLFIVARCDGEPIVWPQPTHHKHPSLFEQPWVPAAECIDWSLPCPSIFTRKRPLKDATLRRIAEGLQRYVIGAQDPFIVRAGTVAHITKFNQNGVGQDPREPLQTVMAGAPRFGIVSAVLAGCGGRASQTPPKPVTEPLNTITAKADQILVSAFLAQHNGGAIGHAATEPVSTLTQGMCQQQVVEAVLSDDDRAGGERVAAFLLSYYSSAKGQHQDVREPLHTLTTKARFALVKVQGVLRPIVDIGVRMLTPDEGKAAQGFPRRYEIATGANGEQMTKTTQYRLIGNSVCPGMAEAVAAAQFAPAVLREAEAAAA